MSSKRPPAQAPDIPGFTYLSPLGTGGFSDVFLYEQHRPHRKVAVKVLLADVSGPEARRRFEDEANLMAQLSTHPYIVTIYQAEITADSRSYLAMEYCSRPGLDTRYRRSPLRVDEALALGIQICSAVETAHRAGIIHRDIKPANVLTTDYNRPALTDFGISGTSDTNVTGLSIPWSAPEAFETSAPPGVHMDVYSLGATIYTVLAGHSPFVRPGGDNAQTALIERITNSPLTGLQRPDVPASLNQVLAAAMAKNPRSRFGSAAELARALQRIQVELGLSVTSFEVLDDSLHEPTHDQESEATRVRSVQSIDDAQRPAASPLISGVPGQRAGRGDAAGRPRAFAPGKATPRFESVRAAQPVPAPEVIGPQDVAPGEPAPNKFPRALILAAVLSVLLVAAVLGLNQLTQDRDDPRLVGPTLGGNEQPADALPGGTVPQVTNFEYSTVGETITFKWQNPEPNNGDFYRWSPVTATSTGAVKQTNSASATLPRSAQETCLQVKLVRDDGRVSEPARFCTSAASEGTS
ncbi:serine/threonine protein kinase [Arthrobacter sp. MYb211]|uniref:serine/threonine-protein kinase n=1 Tax=unclassified Arthrobacter TaxID=235627 RepID=UPI000CFD7B14|nr:MULTISPECIES: serine/threonine-protein kinase [unclassified Arthrobacter]PRA13446.1 serine/threonine protein kinase [Arthrobacter sp. MYb221]PRC10644.1 serine/threonine protein kinase [Arthrobacter sp. MYb211]